MSTTIRQAHTHGDKTCFTMSWTDGRSKVRDAKVLNVLGRRFLVAYKPYTGHWYAFDPDTGKEIGTLTPALWELMRPLTEADLVLDPDCVT